MGMRPIDQIRMDKSVVRTFASFEEADRADAEFWLALTPHQRWEHAELMRQLNHADYDPTTSRIPRPVAILERPRNKLVVGARAAAVAGLPRKIKHNGV
jgi:hypothetical protein